ncbi:MAG: Gfo/Idh/MocA family oxidoreductase [Acidimicrobiia bacterium]|nr:Gfo/Idh/MocA family oxidoreductase [Acidimicrobiia bacterium]
MTIGVGLIGCGGMGSWHAGNLAAQPGLAVVAVADAVPAAAASLASSLGARVQDGLELIGSDDVDAVLIASSDETHARFAVAAIEVGKPCLCEKPLGTTIEQARAVLDAEVAAGRRLVRVGFMRELDPAHAQVASALAGLGPITKVRCVHRNVDDEHRSVEALFAQSLVHDIHTIRWLTGAEFERVTVHVVSRGDGFHDLLLVGELTSGGLGTIEFEDHGFAYEVQVEVTAEGGMASTLPHPRVITRAGAIEALSIGTDWFARFEEAYRVEIEDWARCLGDGTFGGPTVWDGFVAQMVARAGELAMESDAVVAVELPARPSLYGDAR